MRNVVAVSMDMNAFYASAFRERYSKIKIVYDGFHLIKNYNDMVLTEIRRNEQRRLIEEMDQARSEGDKEKYNELLSEYKMFKCSRYLLLSNKKTFEDEIKFYKIYFKVQEENETDPQKKRYFKQLSEGKNPGFPFPSCSESSESQDPTTITGSDT